MRLSHQGSLFFFALLCLERGYFIGQGIQIMFYFCGSFFCLLFSKYGIIIKEKRSFAHPNCWRPS